VAGLTACSSPSSAASPTATTSALQPNAVTFDAVTVSGPLGEKPVVLIGDTAQQTRELGIQDVVPGTGTAATASSTVTVNYLARSAKTKRPFDSSWDRGKPYTFVPSKVVFAAFKTGVVGMKPGGRRLVVVPGRLAFGTTPPANSGLGPNETLVFVIDLVSVA
jgi:peptidylprolyl isomerase